MNWSDRYTVNWVPNVGPVTAYALKREQFGRTAEFHDPADDAVYSAGDRDA
jgi:hypothetical protein